MFIVNLIAAAGQALSKWRHKQHALAELMALDDRSLPDIGIRRSEIPAIIQGYHKASANPHETVTALTTQRLASGRTWFPWFPAL